MKRNDILFLLISGFILVLAWIGFSIYHNLATSTVSTIVGNQLRPIPGTFDMTTINNLKKRDSITPDFNAIESQNNAASVSPTPKLAQTPTPIVATSSAPVATEGGSISQ